MTITALPWVNQVFANLSGVFPLPDGTVLLAGATTGTYILSPGADGLFVTGEIVRRPATLPPYSHGYHCSHMDHLGRVWLHGSEFGTGASRTSIYDPVAGTWSSFTTALGSHLPVCVLDDGRVIGPTQMLPAGATDLTGVTSIASGDQVYSSESGYSLLPDGRVFAFHAFAGDNIDVYQTDYDAGFVAAGSFDGNGARLRKALTGLTGYGSVTAAFQQTPIRFTENWRVTYEIGPTMWMPKINKAVCVGGQGWIWTWDPATDTIARPAHLGSFDKSTLAPGIGSFEFGTVHADTLSPTTTLKVDLIVNNAIAVYNALVGQGGARTYIYVRKANGDVVGYATSGVSVVGNVATFTLTARAVTNSSIAATFATTDKVFYGAPFYNCMDSPGCLLPNGDLLVLGGFEGASNGMLWNDNAHLLKWDGSASVAVPAQSGTPTLLPATRAAVMFPLPSGEVLIHSGNSTYIYTPTTAEATPLAGSRPVVTSAPGVIEPGSTFTLGGNQLNGIHEGAAFGDDGSPRTNFPIVRFRHVASGNVFYARTWDWSYRGIQPNRPSTCKVVVPLGLPAGSYEMTVVASGVPSLPHTCRVRGSDVGGSSTFIPFRS